MNCNTVILYTVRFRRKHLRKWAERTPKMVGAALAAETVAELLSGDTKAIRSSKAVDVNARQQRREAFCRGRTATPPRQQWQY